MSSNWNECMGLPFLEFRNEPTAEEVVELINATLKAYEALEKCDSYFDELEQLALEYFEDEGEF
jgi:hypothetical protein